MEQKAKGKIGYLVFLASFAYYGVLSSRAYTWIFASQDSGDWLAASTWWMTPQPVGSPLYILLGHGLNLLPWSLPMLMTLLLSALPAAITIALVYKIVLLKTGSRSYALVGSVVLLGASVFLTQSTILEEYTLAVMFLILAYWLYLTERPRLALLALGFGISVHIFVLLTALVWLLVERRNWKYWLAKSWVLLLPVIALYSLVPITMAIGIPLIGGSFSIAGVWHYATDTASSVGYNISLADFPKRIGIFLGFTVTCLGLAVIPLASTMKRLERWHWMALSSVILSFTYFLFSVDPSTWTFMCFGLPFAAILAGIGLSRISIGQRRMVTFVAVALVLVNGFFLNANSLAKAEPIATDVETELKALPQGAYVIVQPGHYSMALFYVMAQGRSDLTPILWQETLDQWPKLTDLKPWYYDYCAYYAEHKGIESILPMERIVECYDKGVSLYIAGAPWALDTGMNPPWTTLVKSYITMAGTDRVRLVTNVKKGGLIYGQTASPIP